MAMLGKFSQQEIQQLTIGSILVILVFLSMFVLVIPFNLLVYGLLIGGALILFLLHEFGHKFMAQTMGYPAHFKLVEQGAMFTAISIILPIKFIAPGTVAVQSYGASNDVHGKIALVGPMVNIVMGGILLLVSGLLNNMELFTYTGYLLLEGDRTVNISIGYLVLWLARLSFTLAVFNLIPYGPMDGLKVMTWDRDIFYASIGFAIVAWLSILFLV